MKTTAFILSLLLPASVAMASPLTVRPSDVATFANDSLADLTAQELRKKAIEDSIKAVREQERQVLRRDSLARALGVSPDELSEQIGLNSILFNPLTDDNLRYLPGRNDDPIRYAKPRHKLFMAAFAGFESHANHSQNEIGNSVPMGAMLGYRITRMHAVRAGFDYSQFSSKRHKRQVRQIGLNLDYMFDLSNYVRGWNEYRKFGVSAVIGGSGIISGMYHNRINDRRVELTIRGRAGLNFDIALSNQGHFFFEPYIALDQDRIDRTFHASKYDVQWGVLTGYRLDTYSNDVFTFGEPSVNYNPNLFYESTYGFNTYLGGDLGLMKGLGANVSMMLGKWFDDRFGARIGWAMNDSYWKKYETGATYNRKGEQTHTARTTKYRNGALTVRAEMLIDPLHFIPSYRDKEDQLFDLNLSLGAQMGLYRKEGAGMNCHTPYFGATFAADFLYRIAPGTWVFIEPRFEWLKYNKTINVKTWEDKRFTEKLFNISGGIRLQRPNDVVMGVVKGVDDFRPSFTVGIQLGTTKTMGRARTTSEGAHPLNFNIGVWGRYDFTRVVGVQLEVEYQRSNHQQKHFWTTELENHNIWGTTSFCTRHDNLLNFKLAPTINLSNWWMGYDSDRRVNLILLAGITAGANLHPTANVNDGEYIPQGAEPEFDFNKNGYAGGCFGLVLAFDVDYKINDHWHINLRPEGISRTSHRYTYSAKGLWSFMPGTTFGLSVGSSYKF